MKYIALLRGINVGGHKIIKMAELGKQFTAAGFKNIKTLINSGNIIFETGTKGEDTLRKKIEKLIKDNFGFDVPVILRTADEIKQVIEKNPYKENAEREGSTMYVTFFPVEPDAALKESVEALTTKEEFFALPNRELYYYLPVKDRDKILTTLSVIEKKFKLTGTTRDIKTVNKIMKLME